MSSETGRCAGLTTGSVRSSPAIAPRSERATYRSPAGRASSSRPISAGMR